MMNKESCNATDVSDWFLTRDAQETIRKPLCPGNFTLARGAFGEVNVAIHTRENWRFLAVKSIVLAPSHNNQWGQEQEAAPTKLSRELFHEICALRGLNPHPNIVELVGVYADSSSTVNLAFAYCPSDLYTTLEWRRRTLLPPLSLPCLQGIFHQLLSALQHCHSKGIVHLDVKPGNLLVTRKGSIQLCDFGLAQPLEKKTQPEQAKGMCTLFYRPPELLLGSQEVAPAIDMYSAGLVGCELVAGYPIFRGGNVLGQLAATFEVLGSPTPETWPTVEEMPDYGKLQFVPKNKQPLATILPRALESPGLLHLLEHLVVLDPSQRHSAATALEQEWFQQQSSAVDRSKTMQAELLPPSLQEPLLLSNPNQDISIASQRALEMAAAKRGFLKSLHSWRKDDTTTESSMLQSRCSHLCPHIRNAEEETLGSPYAR